MRLLKREQRNELTGTNGFSLVKFDPSSIPCYAIFSHRWGPEEVTLKDLEDGAARTKAGYRKLKFCGEQAARDGLLYFWIDTCCIDKTSSAELSEAINSMFKWYQNATKCYAYLPDVSVCDNAGDVSARAGWELAFEKSEWFTRGWTLQELIAPTVVEFFSVEGRKLGDKKSLEQRIHQITGISVEALQGKPLSTIDVQERMSWTTGRQTTVDEDAVYCLLGIFDIHMSLIYGEGQQKALARLQRKIRRSYDPGPPGVRGPIWAVPFERNALFTGREPQLAELEEKLFTEEYTSKVAVIGLGGVGKTQVVLEFLYRTKEKRKHCSIMWIPAITIETLRQGYLMVAQQLKISGWEDENADLKKLVQDYLSQEDAGQWLLVFDNADDIDLWTAAPTPGLEDTRETASGSMSESRRLIDCLPRNKQGCIIFTTRDRKAAVKFAQQNIVTVPEMSEAAATQLLKNSLARPGLIENAQDVTALLGALTYLPLAITQATAYINANDITLADYVSSLEEKEEETIEMLSEEFEDFGRYRDVKNPVATTWLISFERIRRTDPLAAEYLSFIACLNPRGIPQFLLPPGPSRKKEIEAIGTLTAYSFIGWQPANTALDLHRLVHLTTRNWLRQEGLLSHWTKKAITRLNEVFPSGILQERSVWRMILPHTHQVLASDPESEGGKHKISLMWKYGRCLRSDGRWSEAEAVFTQIIAIGKDQPGEESDLTLDIMSWLAATYGDQGRWTEAEQLCLQVIEAQKVKVGAEYNDKIKSISSLARVYLGQGRWEKAEKLFIKVTEAWKTKLGDDHPYVLSSTHNLATTYQNQGRLDEAERMHLHVTESYKATLGADHPHTLASITSLAVTYMRQARWRMAEELFIQLIETYNIKLGPDHPDTLVCNDHLATILRHQGRWKEAERLLLEIIGGHTRSVGAGQSYTLNGMFQLALVYNSTDRLKEAESLLLQVVEAHKAKVGPDHPQVLSCIHHLAITWKKLGRDADAIQLMRECVQRRTLVLNTTHPHCVASRELLSDWEAEQSSTGNQVGT